MAETPGLDVRAIRFRAHGIGSTQETFAAAIGVPLKTLQGWEQERRKPTGAARVLLTLLAADPGFVARTLARAR